MRAYGAERVACDDRPLDISARQFLFICSHSRTIKLLIHFLLEPKRRVWIDFVHITVGLMEGTVREVGPVATVIETEEGGLLNRHSIPNTKMLNEAVR